MSAPGANTQFVAAGDLTTFPSGTESVLASSLSYSIAPTIMGEADRTMYAGFLGTTTANGSGQILVYIDDLPNTTGNPGTRTWYDGISYAPAAAVPEPSTYALILGAATLAFVALRRRRS